MGGLLQAVRGAFGRSADGQKDNTGSGASNQGALDEGKALQKTQDAWTDLKNAYIVYHQSIWESLLFYANQSWIDWDDARKVWQPQQPTDEWVPRPRINRFSPTIDAVASNIYQFPEVEASTKAENDDLDPESSMVARVATKLAAYAVEKEGLKKQFGTSGDRAGLAANLFCLCGGLASIIQVKSSNSQQQQKAAQATSGYQCDTCDKWNQMPVGQEPPKFCPECGNPVEPEDSEMVAPVVDEQGQPVMEDLSEYELSLRIESNLGAFPRPGSTSLDDSPYLLWAIRRPTDMIWYMWEFDAQPDAIWPDGYAVTYEHALNFWYTGYSNSTVQVKDSCMTLEMYVPPKKVKDFPGGYYQVVINDKPAFTEEWKFPEHPVTFAYYLVLPTIFFPRSVGFDLVQIQRELNSYESVIKLHSMVAAVDPIVVDANTIVTEITGRSDKVIKWRAIGPNSEPPHRMGSGHLDDGIYKQRDNLHAEFQNISMAVNAFRGEQEGAITASSAISQLRAQAELMFSKPVKNWNDWACETVRKYVKFIQFYFTFEQIGRIIGPGMEAEIRAFKAADLNSMIEFVSTSHGLPKTRDEKRQEMMTMWDKGALDLSDPGVRSRVYELFGETGMQKSFNKDATNARLENQEFKTWNPQTGPPPEVHPMPLIEDMGIHLYFHKDQAKSQDFKKWPPKNQELLLQHVVETTMMMMQQAAGQAAMGAMAGGSKGKPEGKPDEKPDGAPDGQKSQAQVNGNAGATASQGK